MLLEIKAIQKWTKQEELYKIKKSSNTLEKLIKLALKENAEKNEK